MEMILETTMRIDALLAQKERGTRAVHAAAHGDADVLLFHGTALRFMLAVGSIVSYCIRFGGKRKQKV